MALVGASELAQLMDSTTAGAQLHASCTNQHSTHRNGYSERLLTTQEGDLSLAIPRQV